MNNGAGGVRVAHPLFQAEGGGSTPTSALDLVFADISMELAVRLNHLWHSRLPTIDKRLGNRLCYGAEHDGLLFAVAIWTNPVASGLPQDSWLELRRLAISGDAPKNTASRMIGWMARDIRKRRPDVERLVSYQDCDTHAGTIYRAAGWTPVETGGGGAWKHGSRQRSAVRIVRKIRWEKSLIDGPPVTSGKYVNLLETPMFPALA